MFYPYLLKHQVFQIRGRLFFNQKHFEDMPWGEVDWQSGVERWKLTYYGLFNEWHSVETAISRLPEAVNFIDSNTIDWNDEFITFDALTIFVNNPYFNLEILDISDFGLEGHFANALKEIIGDFKIIRKAEHTEFVSWSEYYLK